VIDPQVSSVTSALDSIAPDPRPLPSTPAGVTQSLTATDTQDPNAVGAPPFQPGLGEPALGPYRNLFNSLGVPQIPPPPPPGESPLRNGTEATSMTSVLEQLVIDPQVSSITSVL